MNPSYTPLKGDLSSTTTSFLRWLDESNIPRFSTELNTAIDSDVLLGYRSLVCDPIRRGDGRTPNPWSYSKTHASFGVYSETSRSGTASEPNTITNSATVMPFQGANLDFGDLDGRVYDDLVSKFYEKLRGDLDLSVSAFQAKQSAKMFSLSDQLVKYTSRKTKLINKVGSAWLEYVYGLKPLVSDIYTAAKESLDFQQKRADAYMAQAKGTEHDSITTITGGANTGGEVTYYTTGDKTIMYRVGCHFDLNGQSDVDRFTSLNPLSIAWELVPYSFVVDWVVDVGGYLRNAESAALYTHRFRNGYISRLEITKVSYSLSVKNNQPDSFRAGYGSGFFENVNFQRGVLLGAPFPRPPRLDVKLGSGRLLNAAALLSQFIGRR